MTGKLPIRISMRFQGLSPKRLVDRIAAQSRQATADAVRKVSRLAEANARSHSARFSRSGRFRDSIGSRFRREGDRFIGEVFSELPYADRVETKHGVFARAMKQAANKFRAFFNVAFTTRFK